MAHGAYGPRFGLLHMSRDRETVWVYPTEEQAERWSEKADEFDMSMSEFVKSMTEAGLKKFDVTVEPRETHEELRQQRNDLRDELHHARDRIQELEDRLHHGERGVVREYVEANPGATIAEIVRHVGDSVPARVSMHLDDMEGDVIRFDSDTERYYPKEKAESTAE